MSRLQYNVISWEREPVHLLNLSESSVVTLCGLLVPNNIDENWTGELVICKRCASKRQHLDSIEGLEHKPKGPHETKS